MIFSSISRNTGKNKLVNSKSKIKYKLIIIIPKFNLIIFQKKKIPSNTRKGWIQKKHNIYDNNK